MKRSITAILAFAVASLALVACSEGDTIIQPGGATTTGISVAGVGRVFAAPDVVVLRLGVDVERAVVADAREAAAAAMQKVVASLKANGILPWPSFRLRSRSGTHMAPFSIEARRRFGKRSSTP